MEKYVPQKNLPFKAIRETVFPAEIQIQTHTRCNGRCVMCPYTKVHKKLKHGIISETGYKRLVDECASFGIKEFKPFLMNEPLLDHRLPELIRYARLKMPEVKIGFSTNGQYLSEEIAKDIIESGVNEVWVNFSGNSKSTYGAIMKGLDFDLVKRNIISFVETASRLGRKLPVFISMVETKKVLDEIEESKNFWKDFGVSVIPIPLNNRGGNINNASIKVFEQVKDRRCCDRPFFKIYILFNGDVILCSSDWKREHIIGNALKEGIYAVWHGKKQMELRQRILKKDYDKLSLCKSCDYIAIY
jgi:radical SAM protein with 4Fe4S-binding SPASM domain